MIFSYDDLDPRVQVSLAITLLCYLIGSPFIMIAVTAICTDIILRGEL